MHITHLTFIQGLNNGRSLRLQVKLRYRPVYGLALQSKDRNSCKCCRDTEMSFCSFYRHIANTICSKLHTLKFQKHTKTVIVETKNIAF